MGNGSFWATFPRGSYTTILLSNYFNEHSIKDLCHFPMDEHNKDNNKKKKSGRDGRWC